MSYKDTIHLPHTDFPMKANLAEREAETLRGWENDQIYREIQTARKGMQKYVLHDGPPNANSGMHIGTALNRVLKDIIVKHKTMTGHEVPFTPGWDCLGMPIEYEVEKKAGKRLAPREIRKRCRKFAEEYIDIQRQEFKRLGEFADWERPYITMSREYEANVLGVFKKLVSEGHIYRAKRPVHWCTKCQTALAQAELEYMDMSSASIYVRFRTDEPNVSLLIWTTTPWTLPANVACAVHAELKYDFMRIGNEVLILASALRDRVVEKLQSATITKGSPPVEKTVTGKELEGMSYRHPLFDKRCKVILSDFVSAESGTGCVHIAPGHGYEDYQAGLQYDLPVVSPVDEQGKFTSEAPEFEGQYVFDADKHIIEKLGADQLLLFSEELVHSYPCCWRCKSPLIFRATAQWFLKMDHNDLRKRCIDEIEKVSWIPGWSRDRILHNVRERPDWCLSRQRTWGIPIPALYCEKCDESILDLDVIGKAEEVTRGQGSEGWFDLEDFGDLSCPKCGGKEFRKEQNIFDVWFDSSSSWTVIRDQGSFPADLYCEGVDQHRGWFQHSLWLSLIVEGRSSFKSVLTHGLVLDDEMRKMSKSLGNIVSPMSVIDKHGADVLRLCFASLDYTSDLPFDFGTLESIVIAYRKMRNTFKFLLGNLYDFETPVKYKELLELDKLMLHRLTLLTKRVRQAYETFEFHKVYRSIYDYCVVDLSKFYFDILKDRLYTSGKTSLDRRSAQTVLREILISLAELSAPITPFTAEEAWQEAIRSLGLEPGSVHLQLMPDPNPEWIDDKLSADYETIEEVRDDVLVGIEEARKAKIIGKSLDAKVTIWTENESLRKFLNQKLHLLPAVFIVSHVSIDKLPNMLALKRIAVTVEQAEGDKCERCWIRSGEVGKNVDYPTLCTKCAEVLKEGDYEEKRTGAI